MKLNAAKCSNEGSITSRKRGRGQQLVQRGARLQALTDPLSPNPMALPTKTQQRSALSLLQPLPVNMGSPSGPRPKQPKLVTQPNKAVAKIPPLLQEFEQLFESVQVAMRMLKRAKRPCTLQSMRECAQLSASVLSQQKMQQLMGLLPGLKAEWIYAAAVTHNVRGVALGRNEWCGVGAQLVWNLVDLQPAADGGPVVLTLQSWGHFQTTLHHKLQQLADQGVTDTDSLVCVPLDPKPAETARKAPIDVLEEGAKRASAKMQKAVESSRQQRAIISGTTQLGEKPAEVNPEMAGMSGSDRELLMSLDPALLARVTKMNEAVVRDREEGHHQAMLSASETSRLSAVAEAMRTLFMSKKKSALMLTFVVEQVNGSAHVRSTTSKQPVRTTNIQAELLGVIAVDVGKMIRRLCSVIPGWCSLKQFTSGQFVMLKKEADFSYAQVKQAIAALN